MNWFTQLSQRLMWAHRAFVADDSNPIIKLDNGVSLDLANNRVILEGNFALHVTGNLSLTADGDVEIRDHVNRIPEDTNEERDSFYDYLYDMFGFSKDEDGDTSGRGSREPNL